MLPALPRLQVILESEFHLKQDTLASNQASSLSPSPAPAHHQALSNPLQQPQLHQQQVLEQQLV